jgi:hypothetical protein
MGALISRVAISGKSYKGARASSRADVGFVDPKQKIIVVVGPVGGVDKPEGLSKRLGASEAYSAMI